MILAIVLTVALGSSVVIYFVYSRRSDAEYTKISSNIAASIIAMTGKSDFYSLKEKVAAVYDECKSQGAIPDAETSAEDELAVYHAKFADIEKTGVYRSILTTLQTFMKNSGVLFIYCGYIDPDRQSFIYLADGTLKGSVMTPGDSETIDETLTNDLVASSYSYPGYIHHSDTYGLLCTTFIPVYDRDGSYVCDVCADVSMQTMVSQRASFLINLVLFLLLLSTPFTIMILHYIDSHLVKPIHQMNSAVTNFVSNKENENQVSGIASLNIHTQDEVEMLFLSVRKMENDVNRYIADVTREAGEKERMGTELAIATKIQESMLPHIFPAFPDNPQIDLYASMTPAKEVGGDFYDFFLISREKVGIVIGDVSGKGIPGALFMMISKTLLKDAMARGMQPREVFETVNKELCENNEAGMFVTVWIGILDLATGRLSYANAGHENPACRKAGGKFELIAEKHDMVLAAMDGLPYKEHERILEPGDTVFIYTDGVPEATDAHEKMFGTDRMIESLNRDPDADVTQLLANIRKDVDAFVGDAPQFDDLTVLGFLYKGPLCTLSGKEDTDE